MTSSKKTPKARRRPSGERPQPPAQQRVRGGFVVEEGLTLADVFDSTDANRLCVIVDIDRCDTAAASTQTFHLMLCEMHDALKRRCGTHPKGAVLRMTDVGVVLRNGDGERVWAPEGEHPLPTLYAPIDTGYMFASFGHSVVARLRAQPVA